MKKSALIFLCILAEVICISCKQTKEFKKEKSIIYQVLTTEYAGYNGMIRNGFTKRSFNKIRNREELKTYLQQTIFDYHLQIVIDDERIYLREPDKDTTNKSLDPDNYFSIIKTPNTFYVRCTSCTTQNPDYAQLGAAPVCYDALTYDYIVLDFRSNMGGSDEYSRTFFQVLTNLSYSGRIILVQDRWSFSSGELYGIFYNSYFLSGKFTPDQLVLVGTNSGGAQLYGTCRLFEKENVKFWLPTMNFEENISIIPNYEGEGKGYKPDIYATKEMLKSVIEGLGADLTGIEFR